jgi:hypothetical protein
VDGDTVRLLIQRGRIDAECAHDKELLAQSLSVLLEQW